PTYMDKTGRNGLRVGDLEASDFQDRYNALKAKHLELLKIYPEVDFDLAGEEEKWMAAIERLRQLKLVNGEYFINEALRTGKRILAEGAQGSMLDIDYGTYPFVTSSNTITAGVCTGLGVSPQKIGEVIGITKAYCTRVGSGPFPTELFDEMGEFLQKEGAEFGATTGRPRRCGWIDLPQLRYTIMLNGVTQLVVTKIDVLNKLGEIKMATAYENNGQQTEQLPYDLCDEDCKPVYESFGGWESGLERAATYGMLPEAAQKYVEEIEARLNVPVAMVSTGPGRRELLEKVVS
ncbi:MAG: adenylosuccinate synthetase, partial [Bacteroidota bacterium]